MQLLIQNADNSLIAFLLVETTLMLFFLAASIYQALSLNRRHPDCNLKISLPGVDVILDNIGGSYLQRNLNSLGVDGRLFIIGFQGGIVAEVNLQAVLARRLTIQGILVAQAYKAMSSIIFQ